MMKCEEIGIPFFHDSGFYICLYCIDGRTPQFCAMIGILMDSKISKCYFQLGMTDDRSYAGPNRPPWMKELIAAFEKIEGFNQDYSKHGHGATAIGNFINAGRDLPYILDTIRNPPLECQPPEQERPDP